MKTVSAVILMLIMFTATCFSAPSKQFKDCYKKAMNTLQIRMCIDSEYKLYSADLKNQINKLSKFLNHNSMEQFSIAQKTWRRFEKLDCDFKGSKYSGGTLESIIIGKCYIEKTKHRINEVNEYIKFFKEN